MQYSFDLGHLAIARLLCNPKIELGSPLRNYASPETVKYDSVSKGLYFINALNAKTVTLNLSKSKRSISLFEESETN